MVGDRLALIIATDRYEDPELRQLVAPSQDAEALAAALGDPEIGGFDVQRAVNQTSYEVARHIEVFFADRRREDLLLLYFSGHGLKDDSGRLFLAMTNTERRLLNATAVSASFIQETMAHSRGRQKLLLLDCCYSGAFARGAATKGDAAVHTQERFAVTGSAVLTASDALQYSFEGDQLSGEGLESVFTRALVDGLRTGDADRDADGDISLDELYDYLHDRVVAERPQQRPGKWEWEIRGRIVIARNPRWTMPVRVQRALDSSFPGMRLGAIEELTHLLQTGNDRVSTSAREALQRLTNDDSRQVCQAAATALAAPNVGKVVSGRIQNAAADQEAVASRAERLDAVYGRGRTAEDTGNWQAALREYGLVIQADPDYRDAVIRRNICQLRQHAEVEDWPGVLAIGQELAALDPAAADIDGLVSAARERLRRQHTAPDQAGKQTVERVKRLPKIMRRLTAKPLLMVSAVLAILLAVFLVVGLHELTTSSSPDLNKPLRAHVPASFRSTCTDVRPQNSGAVTSVSCTPAGNAAHIWFYQFTASDAMFSSYRQHLDRVATSGDIGNDCQTDLAADVTYHTATSSGRALCVTAGEGGKATLIWTSDQLLILSEAEGGGNTDTDRRNLYMAMLSQQFGPQP